MKRTIVLCMALLSLAVPLWSQTEDIVDRLDKVLGVTLPDGYRQKVKDFAANDTIMRTRSATAYTEEFIVNEMKADWGISKQNQLLFMWSTIYEGIAKKFLYDWHDWLDDENEARSNEYEKSLETINESYKRYKTGFKAYMEAGIAEANRRYNEENRRYNEENRKYNEENRKYNEADRRYKEADRRYKEADKRYNEYKRETIEYLNTSLKAMKDFYCYWKKDPGLINKQEIEDAKLDAKKTLQLCKEYNIDYRAFWQKELGDKKKVDELLKFYGVE